jgi:molybdopterin synthase sulfur carrier subunit
MTVLYFAWLRERIGQSREEVDPPAEIRTTGDLAGWLAAREPRYAAAFANLSAIRVAVDQVQADLETPIGTAREVAFFPPVTGG